MKRKVLFVLCLIVFILSSCEKSKLLRPMCRNKYGYNATDFCGESQEVDDYINDLTSQGADLGQEGPAQKLSNNLANKYEKIIFCLFVISTFLCFSQDRLHVLLNKITIPNDTIAYLKTDMSLVNGIVYDTYTNGNFKYKKDIKMDYFMEFTNGGITLAK